MINLITSRRIYYNDKLLKMGILFSVIEYPKDEKMWSGAGTVSNWSSGR